MMRPALVALALAGLASAQLSFAADAGQALPRKPDAAASGKAASPAGAGGTPKAASLYYYENGRKKALRVDPGWVADFAAPAKPEPGKPRTPVKRFIGGEKGLERLPSGSSPVFRDDNGAARALGGGVIVRLRDAGLPETHARLAGAGLVPVRPLDPEGRTWLVDAPPGLASLELANRLHESGQYESAAPNWWRPRALK